VNLTGIVSLTYQKIKAEYRGPLFALQYDTFRFVYCTILSYFIYLLIIDLLVTER
jgi:hypothetical protein